MNESPNIIHGPDWQTVPLAPITPDPPRPSEPLKAQWKDRVKERTRGRQKKIDWESSVLKYVKEITKAMEWPGTIICREIAGSLRLLTGKYECVEQVLTIWDAKPEKEQAKVFSLDRACDAAGVDRDEFAGLVLSALKKHLDRERAAGITIIDRNFERIIKAAVDHAVTGGAAGAKERVELLKILDRMSAREKVATRREMEAAKKSDRVESQPAPTNGRGAKTLDHQLAELDDIENM